MTAKLSTLKEIKEFGTQQSCEHQIGQKMMGGFPGHPHTHPTGGQVCLNCGLSLGFIIEKRILECDKYYEK